MLMEASLEFLLLLLGNVILLFPFTFTFFSAPSVLIIFLSIDKKFPVSSKVFSSILLSELDSLAYLQTLDLVLTSFSYCSSIFSIVFLFSSVNSRRSLSSVLIIFSHSKIFSIFSTFVLEGPNVCLSSSPIALSLMPKLLVFIELLFISESSRMRGNLSKLLVSKLVFLDKGIGIPLPLILLPLEPTITLLLFLLAVFCFFLSFILLEELIKLVSPASPFMYPLSLL
mmetsp:Transcript_19109/g.19834  ORF Transcript_19109/g.19834 Transcript_19109/m.19834 type:complete len:227 (-) Transcript_19109:1124-1804(-)